MRKKVDVYFLLRDIMFLLEIDKKSFLFQLNEWTEDEFNAINDDITVNDVFDRINFAIKNNDLWKVHKDEIKVLVSKHLIK